MKLSSVVLFPTEDSEGVELSVSENEDNVASRYIVRQILGIDAEELVPKFHGSGLETGRRFYEFTMKPRDIVIRVALNPHFHVNETVSEIRNELYRLISANRWGKNALHFKSGGLTLCTIEGMIVKFETAYFSKIPELQVTFRCPDPIFRSLAPVDYDISDLPTSGSAVEIPDPESTAPHGFTVKVQFTATTSTFVIQDHPTDPEWEFEVTPPSGYVSGDTLEISSEFTNKLVYFDPNVGSAFHMMDKVQLGSIWPMLFPGNNVLYFPQIANFDWLELKYFSAYWGV